MSYCATVVTTSTVVVVVVAADAMKTISVEVSRLKSADKPKPERCFHDFTIGDQSALNASAYETYVNLPAVPRAENKSLVSFISFVLSAAR